MAVAGLLSGDADGGRGPGTGTSRTAAQAAPTAIGLGDALLSNRSIAKQGKGSVTFVDPRTGAEEESISIAVGSPNRIGTVSHTVIVDVEDGGPDTLVAFFFSVVVPEQGLNPRREERRVQVYSRRTRQRIVDTNTPQAPPRGSSDTTWMSFRVIGVDPKGYVVLTVPDAIGTSPFVYTQGIRPGLPSRVVDPGYSPPRLTGVGVHGGVLLTTRFTAVGIELSGFDIGSGTRLWRRTVDARDEPRCVAGRADTFVVMGAGIPLVLNARTGATVVEGSVPACLTIDPTTATGVQTSSGLAGYDLGTAEKLWSLPSSQTSGVGLSVRSVYGGRVYVTTRTSRLVLDARTGRQVEAGWTQAPKAAYDGWSVWSTDKGALVALPTPLGSSPPR
ncbi:PQQ-like beta-propeller repeat protein [Dactylosporangium sp. NBC_01737]|uniref:outer membrane protein assembly factor BamB family protein n=1 Tax=Dactylosporangium sp. NBC_01737 TaxID=2975959 RepID=UPI002E11E58D|nr:PQQ-like beta-propeller repeat protein [Dactylosporangium sp. NBC_01737]